MDYNSSDALIEVRDLYEAGINQQIIIQNYQQYEGRTLNLNELVKVSPTDEGKNLKFETFDAISIVVPFALATGPFNKSEI